MNTNSNLYTIIYTTVVVVIVSALLAFVSQSLKDRQEANEKADTISQMLTAAGFGTKDSFQQIGNAAVIERFGEELLKSFVVDANGTVAGELAGGEVYSPSELKAQNQLLKAGRGDEARLPVFVFRNGLTVVPVYGAGLWGPVWGYIAFRDDYRTINGTYFDHESETAGLGAKIKDDAGFQASFAGEYADFLSDNVFEIVKGGSPKDAEGAEIADNKVDAISGATMTSNGLAAAINMWLRAYAPYFTGLQAAPAEKANN